MSMIGCFRRLGGTDLERLLADPSAIVDFLGEEEPESFGPVTRRGTASTTLVLEQLAAIDKVDEFFDAVDSDGFERATRLMKAARVDAPTIAMVIRKMEAADGEH